MHAPNGHLARAPGHLAPYLAASLAFAKTQDAYAQVYRTP